LQTLLQDVIPTDNRNQKKLLKGLNRIRKSAGQVRDVDVQLEALRSLRVPQEPRRKTRLTQNLLELRAQHERKLRKLLKKEDVREISRRLKKASSELSLHSKHDPLEVARKMLQTATLPSDASQEDLLHRYRIVIKRARYAAEFAAKSDERTQFLAQLQKLQDAIGNWHNWMTLTHSATENLGDITQSSLVAALHNVTRAKLRQAVAAVSTTQLSQPATRRKPTALDLSRQPGTKQPATVRRAGAAA
jgi:CHAD domain-containing protein